MPQADGSMGKYLYCIICTNSPKQFTTLGIGERGDIVRTVHFDDLAAVLSDSPSSEYESTRRNMMAHTLVLEEAMRESTLLPVRFGTVAPDEESVRQVLRRRFGEFHGLLQEMDGRVELGLKAFWYEGIVFQEIVGEDPTIRHLRDGLMGRSVEETYYERIRLGEMIEAAIWRKRDAEAESILAPLRPLAHQSRVNKVITDRMVLNAAFLVDRTRQAEFDQVVKGLDLEMGKRIIFKYVGPVPPYNFVSIVVKWQE